MNIGSLFHRCQWKNSRARFPRQRATKHRLGIAGFDDYPNRRYVSSQLVSWEIAGDTDERVGIITIRSERTFNALTVEMGREFEALVTRVGRELSDPGGTVGGIGGIVLRGEGEKAFSAGGDLGWLRSLPGNSVHANVDAMLGFYNSFLCLRERVPVPVVAALQGPAVGAGACLALACDLRVGASGDVPLLGFPFCRLGIPPGMGALHLLTGSGRLGGAEAAEILLTGKTLTGEEALDRGLLNRMVPRDGVQEEAESLALGIARASHPVAVRSLVRSLRSGSDHGGGSLAECLRRDAYAQAVCYNRKDWGKGLDAVASRTDPVFDGYHSK